MDEITSLVLRYKRGETVLEPLQKALALAVYRFPKRFGLKDRDICSELLLYVYPKIEAIISRFRYLGTSFEVYLQSVLRYQILGLRSEKSNRKRRELLLFIDAVTEYEAMVHRYATMEERIRFWATYRPHIRRPVLRPLHQMFAAGRRLIMFVLKSCLYIRPDQLAAIAELMDMETAQLQHQCDQMRKHIGRQLARLDRLRYRRNRIYMRILATEHVIATVFVEDERIQLRGRLRSQMAMAARVGTLLARASRTPTNAAIARALEVAVGTVNSGLFYLKRQLWEALNEKDGHK